MVSVQSLHPAFQQSQYLFRRRFFKIFGGAFHVYDAGYHCFSCGFNGDIIALNMQAHDLSFVDAVNKIACEWGIDVTDQTRKPKLMIQVGTKPVVGGDGEIEAAPQFKNYRVLLARKQPPARTEHDFLWAAFDIFSDEELEFEGAEYKRRNGPMLTLAGGIALRAEIRDTVYDNRVSHANMLLRSAQDIYAAAPTYDWLCLATRFFRRPEVDGPSETS